VYPLLIDIDRTSRWPVCAGMLLNGGQVLWCAPVYNPRRQLSVNTVYLRCSLYRFSRSQTRFNYAAYFTKFGRTDHAHVSRVAGWNLRSAAWLAFEFRPCWQQ